MLMTTSEHPPSAPLEPLSLAIAPGKSGLPRLVLRHLVDSRYASVAAGGLDWALRTTGDVFSVAGGCADLLDTERALDLLRAHGFADAVPSGAGRVQWMATEAGAIAIDHRPQ